MGQEIAENIDGMYLFLQNQVDQWVATNLHLPKFIRNVIVDIFTEGINFFLDLNYLVSNSFTPARFEAEMKGMSKGSGVEYQTIRRLNLFPELT